MGCIGGSAYVALSPCLPRLTPGRAQDIVLVGGGHAHVAVLRSFGMQPLPGVRLTLVTPSAHTAYRHAQKPVFAYVEPGRAGQQSTLLRRTQWPTEQLTAEARA